MQSGRRLWTSDITTGGTLGSCPWHTPPLLLYLGCQFLFLFSYTQFQVKDFHVALVPESVLNVNIVLVFVLHVNLVLVFVLHSIMGSLE